jgi:hypothetical protein
MIIRALDVNGDWTFGLGKQNYLFDQKAIIQNIRTRLYEFLNNAFWNMNSGADWPRLLGTPGTKQEIVLTCRAIILQSYGVNSVNSISATYYGNTRNIIISYNINTIYTSNFSVQMQINLANILGGSNA